MNQTVHFAVPDPPDLAAAKATSTIQHLGHTLRSDTGHYVRGVIPYGTQSVEVRVSWLPVSKGTQITVLASSDDAMGKGALIAAERIRDAYLKGSPSSHIPSRRKISPLAVIAFALAVLLAIAFLFAVLRA